jgi:hypothetical protein
MIRPYSYLPHDSKPVHRRLEDRRQSLKSQLVEGGLRDVARTLYVSALGQIDPYEALLQSLQGDVAAAGGATGGERSAENRFSVATLWVLDRAALGGNHPS